MRDYLRENPLPTQNFFAYTVAFHNAVNKRLGKQEVDEEAARATWALSCNDSCNEGRPGQMSILGPLFVYLVMFVSVFLIFLVLKRYI